jgi:hypothetical protein
MLIWIALVPLMLMVVAVALVPVISGIIHDERARNREEHSHLFFVPAGNALPAAEQDLKSEVEQRLGRIEAALAQALGGSDGELSGVVITGSKQRAPGT